MLAFSHVNPVRDQGVAYGVPGMEHYSTHREAVQFNLEPGLLAAILWRKRRFPGVVHGELVAALTVSFSHGVRDFQG